MCFDRMLDCCSGAAMSNPNVIAYVTGASEPEVLPVAALSWKCRVHGN